MVTILYKVYSFFKTLQTKKLKTLPFHEQCCKILRIRYVYANHDNGGII